MEFKKILFSTVSVSKKSIIELKILFDTARKFFMPNQKIDFVLFCDEYIEIDGVKTIKIKPDNINSVSHYALLKITSLNYINLDDYDYVFINDSDQMYINYITNEDIDVCSNKIFILSHFIKNLRTSENIMHWSDVLEVCSSDKEHTMGNFFGLPKNEIKKFLVFCNYHWDKNKNHKYKNNFFSLYPEEVLLMKYIIDNQIQEQRLVAQSQFENKGFMTNINAFGNLMSNLDNFKLIHNTKVNMEMAQEIYKKVMK